MSNMSYCRFYNTRLDLGDCLDALCDEERLSEGEARAGRWMFAEFLDFCRENGIITDYDAGEIEALFNGLARKEKEDDG